MGSSSRKKNVLGVGSPLVDLHVEVEPKFLLRHGLSPNNAIAAGEEHRKLFEELQGGHFVVKTRPGGCITNTMRVLRWISQIPEVATYIGAVGKDGHAEEIRAKLGEEGVEFSFEEIQGVATGKCAVLLNQKNRSLCTDLGASRCFTASFLRKKDTEDLIERSGYVYLSAFFLGVSYECMVKLGEICLEKDKCYILNVGAPFVCQKYKNELKELIGYVDVLFGNESEIRAFAIANDIAEGDLREIAKQVANLKKRNTKRRRITLVTGGANPILVCEGREINEFPVPILRNEDVKDTNAAGDAFVGGFLAQFVEGKSIKECVDCGIWAASQVIKRVGCDFDSSVRYAR